MGFEFSVACQNPKHDDYEMLSSNLLLMNVRMFAIVRRLFLSHLFLFLTSVFSSCPLHGDTGTSNAGRYLDIQAEYSDVIYFAFDEPSRIERYDLASQRWVSSVSVPGTIFSIAVGAQGVFIATGDKVYQVGLDGSNARLFHTVSKPLAYNLVLTESYLFIGNDSSNQNWGYLDVVRLDDENVIVRDAEPKAYGEIEGRSGSVHSFRMDDLVYSGSNDRLLVEDLILDAQPDGSLVVFSTFHDQIPDLDQFASFQHSVPRILTYHGEIFDTETGAIWGGFNQNLVAGEVISPELSLGVTRRYGGPWHLWLFNLNQGMVGSHFIEGGVDFIHMARDGSEAVVLFREDPSLVSGFSTEILNLSDLFGFESGNPPPLMGPGSVVFSYEGSVEAGGIIGYWSSYAPALYLYDRERRIHLPPVGLIGVPERVSYWERENAVLIGYENGLITSFDLESGLESVVVSIPSSILAICAGDEEFLVSYTTEIEGDFSGEYDRIPQLVSFNSDYMSTEIEIPDDDDLWPATIITWMPQIEAYFLGRQPDEASWRYDANGFTRVNYGAQLLLSSDETLVLSFRPNNVMTFPGFEFVFSPNRSGIAAWIGDNLIRDVSIASTGSTVLYRWDSSFENVTSKSLGYLRDEFFSGTDELIVLHGFVFTHYGADLEPIFESPLIEFPDELIPEPAVVSNGVTPGEVIATIPVPEGPFFEGSTISIDLGNYTASQYFRTEGGNIILEHAFNSDTPLYFGFTARIIYANGNSSKSYSSYLERELAGSGVIKDVEFNVGTSQILSQLTSIDTQIGYLRIDSSVLSDSSVSLTLSDNPGGFFSLGGRRLYLDHPISLPYAASYPIRVKAFYQNVEMGEFLIEIPFTEVEELSGDLQTVSFESGFFAGSNRYYSGPVVFEGDSLSLRNSHQVDEITGNETEFLYSESDFQNALSVYSADGGSFTPIFVDVAIENIASSSAYLFITANGTSGNLGPLFVPLVSANESNNNRFRRIFLPPELHDIYELYIECSERSFAIDDFAVRRWQGGEPPLIVLASGDVGSYTPTDEIAQTASALASAHLDVFRYGPRNSGISVSCLLTGDLVDGVDYTVDGWSPESGVIVFDSGQRRTSMSFQSQKLDSTALAGQLGMKLLSGNGYAIDSRTSTEVSIIIASTRYALWTATEHYLPDYASDYSPELQFLLDLENSPPPLIESVEIAGFPPGYGFSFTINREDRLFDVRVSSSINMTDWLIEDVPTKVVNGRGIITDELIFYIGENPSSKFWKVEVVTK